MPYIYEAEETFKGIPLKRYYLPPFAYDNGTLLESNAGFCDKDTCAPYGIQRMDPCRYGKEQRDWKSGGSGLFLTTV